MIPKSKTFVCFKVQETQKLNYMVQDFSYLLLKVGEITWSVDSLVVTVWVINASDQDA